MYFGKKNLFLKNLQVLSIKKPKVLSKNVPLNLPAKKPVRTLQF
jgi:hypothetical protein